MFILSSFQTELAKARAFPEHIVNAEGVQLPVRDLLSAAGKYKVFCLKLMYLEEVR